MPLTPPPIDDRAAADILAELVARIPSHAPEWTNHGRGDPGITLLELFSWLGESLIYRVNQIPERNRRQFLALLGLKLDPGAVARGLVQFKNERGPLETLTLPSDTEVRAGEIPFRTEMGLDILPVEGFACVKQKVALSGEALSYYELLYQSQRKELGASIVAYETTPLGGAPVALDQTEGRSLWLALLVPASRDPSADKDALREALLGRTLSIGLSPVGPTAATIKAIDQEPPKIEVMTPMGIVSRASEARYRPLPAIVDGALLWREGVIQVRLPSEQDGLVLWDRLEATEEGTGDLPPVLPDPEQSARLIVWLRLRLPEGTAYTVRWAGINAVPVRQGERIRKLVGTGDGEPDQRFALTPGPVVPGTVQLQTRLRSTSPGVEEDVRDWAEVMDLYALPREGASAGADRGYVLDAEGGEIRFGDGLRGARPQRGASVIATWTRSHGAAGNVAPGAIKSCGVLPAGLKVTSPLNCQGGRSPERVSDGEQRIGQLLRHRDRLVTPEDHHDIAWQTPGVDLGRVDVIPAWSADRPMDPPGRAAGTVTLMVVPKEGRPGGPPTVDGAFLAAICRWLEPRRLVGVELQIRSPQWLRLAVSVGISVEAGRSLAEVSAKVEAALKAALSPTPEPGWPRSKAVSRAELEVVVARVAGVTAVNAVKLARLPDSPLTPLVEVERVPVSGIELPWLAQVAVGAAALSLSALVEGTTSTSDRKTLPVPVLPEICD